MAIRFGLSGDRFSQRSQAIVPKAFAVATYPAAWASTILPAAGHLVIQDTTSLLNDAVKRCVASDIPYGLVESVNSNTTGLATVPLSVIKLVRSFSLVLECSNAATLGHSIQATGAIGTIPIDGILRDQVKDVAAGSGVGIIVEIDVGSAPFLIRVEFGS